MNNQPLVTVTMPVYNGERTIQLAINSLLNQTYKNWLCVIVNDCSTDGTAAILSKYENDTRFKIIHLPVNKGRGNARQVALENAEGDYICYLDADDFYHPEKIFKQVKIFKQHANITLVSCAIGSFDLKRNICSIRGVGNNSVRIYKDSRKLPFFFPASVMVRLENIFNIRYNIMLDIGEDFDFLIKCLRKESNYYMLSDVLYYYEEVGAVTSKKLIHYQKKSLKALYLIYKNRPLLMINHIIIKITKIVYYIFFIPFFGIDNILKKRGSSPELQTKEEYEKILTSLLNSKS
jgi:glycosyltransferase involved in cell wall biosynthesis